MKVVPWKIAAAEQIKNERESTGGQHYRLTAALLAQLNKLAGTKLTLDDWDGWLDGGKGYKRFDAAVLKVLGRGLFDAGDTTARLPELLVAFLSHRSAVPGQITVRAGGHFVFVNKDGRKQSVVLCDGLQSVIMFLGGANGSGRRSWFSAGAVVCA